MSTIQGEKFRQEIVKIFRDHGVSEFLFVFKDPDSKSTLFHTPGDVHWLIGICEAMTNRAWEEINEQADEQLNHKPGG